MGALNASALRGPDLRNEPEEEREEPGEERRLLIFDAVLALVVAASVPEHEPAAIDLRVELRDLVVLVAPCGFGQRGNDLTDGITIRAIARS